MMPSKRRPGTIIPPPLPPIPSAIDRDLLLIQQIVADLKDLVAKLRQRNLQNAVLLAQQAACGNGPLVEHFVELGRRYSKLLDEPQKLTLRVLKGGVA